MGTPRLRPIFPSKFATWVKRIGYKDEFDFWSSLSGIQSKNVVDHMTTYLRTLGYTGNPNDQFRKFLRDQVGLLNMSPAHVGTLFDEVNEFFDGTYAASIASVSPATGIFIDLQMYEGFNTAGVYQ